MEYQDGYIPFNGDVGICEHCGGVFEVVFPEKRVKVPQLYTMSKRAVNDYMMRYPDFLQVWMSIKSDLYSRKVEAAQRTEQVARNCMGILPLLFYIQSIIQFV
jgi:hypothetical protein